jgi:hypothetical protein
VSGASIAEWQYFSQDDWEWLNRSFNHVIPIAGLPGMDWGFPVGEFYFCYNSESEVGLFLLVWDIMNPIKRNTTRAEGMMIDNFPLREVVKLRDKLTEIIEGAKRDDSGEGSSP